MYTITLQIIKENPIETFILGNLYFIIPLIIVVIFLFFTNKYLLNFSYKCPNCSSDDISRVKKNKYLKTIGFDNKTMKFNCRKCHYKFYVIGNNRERKKKN
jgi:predicted RNA-binding Zn-ribbon protein involved in translation (DUF1610 family)